MTPESSSDLALAICSLGAGDVLATRLMYSSCSARWRDIDDMARSLMLRPRAMRYIRAPIHGTNTSSTAQPALPHPLSSLSPNRSHRQRNQIISAEIQMKNQKLQSRTSPKSVVIASIVNLPASDHAACDVPAGGRDRSRDRLW